MNPVYIILFIAAVALACWYLSTLFQKVNVVLLAVLGIALFFAEYCVVSGVLLAFDKFYVSYALGISFAINVLLCLMNIKKLIPALKKVELGKGAALIALLVMMVFTTFTWAKAENIAPTLDAGVYGQKAIDMIYGTNTASTEVEEYNTDNEAVRESVRATKATQNGLYLERGTAEDEMVFQYHAFPAWPAVMALWGTMFGFANMWGVLSLLFACAGLGVFFFARKFAKNGVAPFLALCLFGFAPLMVNLAKTGLTETIYTAFVVIAMLLLAQGEKKVKWLAALPLAALPFLHLSTFMYAPMILIVLLFLDIRKKETIYSSVGILFNIALLFSFFYGEQVASVYMTAQLRKLPEPYGVQIAAAMAIVMMAVQFLYILMARRKQEPALLRKTDDFLEKRMLLVLRVILIGLLAVCAVKAYLLCFTGHYGPGNGFMRFRDYGGTGIGAVKYLNIVQVSLYTGIVCVPYLIYKMFSKKTLWGVPEYGMAAVFLYALAVAAIMRTDNPVLYYGARYYAIFLVPAIILLACMLIQSKKLTIAFLVVAIAVSLPFNVAQWSVVASQDRVKKLAGVAEHVAPGSVVLLHDRYYASLLPESLRNMNGNLVYADDVAGEVMAMYPDKEFYYVTGTLESDENMQLVYEGTTRETSSFYGFDGIYPTELPETMRKMYVYRVTSKDGIVEPSLVSHSVWVAADSLVGEMTAVMDTGTKGDCEVVVRVRNADDPAQEKDAVFFLEKQEDGSFALDIDLNEFSGKPGAYTFDFYARALYGAMYEMGSDTVDVA